MKYNKLPKREYCYWCQKIAKIFYGEIPNKTAEYRGKNVIYNEVVSFCHRCHLQSKYETGEIWDENLRRIKDSYNKGYFENIGE